MAAPEFVPITPLAEVRVYTSPPRRPESWRAQRPGDLDASQPRGDLFGSQGPDQGYVLSLARRFDGNLVLDGAEHHDDAVAGCVAVALKRASLLGRAPVVHDLTVAFTVWGFLDTTPDPELVSIRKSLFAEVANPHHYGERRRIADATPETTLGRSHAQVAEAHERDWRSLLLLHPSE